MDMTTTSVVRHLLQQPAGNGTLQIPLVSVSDYVRMAYLFTFSAVGIPINVFTLVRLSRQYMITGSRVLLLNVNLNVSDLMILVFYALATAIWLANYYWLAGDLACKLLKFLQLMSCCCSSNAIVCIGFDRLSSLASSGRIKTSTCGRCKRMIVVAWCLAFVCSVPQLLVWQNYRLNGQSQCVSWYKKQSFEQRQFHNGTKLQTVLRLEIAYDIYHLIVTFWLPCLLVVSCYVVILKRVLGQLRERPQVQIVAPSRHLRNDSRRFNPRTYSDRRLDSGIWRKPARHHQPQFHFHDHQSQFRQQHQQLALRRSSGQMRIRRTKYRTLKVTMLIVTVYILCWAPYNILALWNRIHPDSYRKFDDAISFLYGLIALNAMLNPLIYGTLTLALYRRGNSRNRRNFAYKEPRPQQQQQQQQQR